MFMGFINIILQEIRHNSSSRVNFAIIDYVYTLTISTYDHN